MQISRELNNELNAKFAAKPLLIHERKILHKQLATHLTGEQTHSEKTFVQFLFDKNKNVSTFYKKLSIARTKEEIKTPPAYNTRMREGNDVVDIDRLKKAYLLTRNIHLTNKAKENLI